MSWGNSIRCALIAALAVQPACGGGGGPGDSDDLALVSVKMAQCTNDSPERFAALTLPFLSSDDIACIAAADDCDAILGCVGMGFGTDCVATDTCADGQTLLTCRGNIPFEIDCGEYYLGGGPSCLTAGDGEGHCGVAVCDVPAESCDGSVRVDCDAAGGVQEEFDCGALGLACTETAGGGTECGNFTEVACEDGPGRCDGDTAVGCEGGFETRLDCPEFVDGSSCVVDTAGGGDVFCGFGAECDVNAGSPSETCEGTALRFCLLGRSVTVECSAVGLTTCATDVLGTGCR